MLADVTALEVLARAGLRDRVHAGADAADAFEPLASPRRANSTEASGLRQRRVGLAALAKRAHGSEWLRSVITPL